MFHHWIVAAEAQILDFRTLLVQAVRGARSRELTVRVNVDEAHCVLAHARTIVLTHLLIDHQIVLQSLFPIYFILFYHRVGIHLVDATAVEHVRVSLVRRVLLAQHLSLAYVGHGVASAEADLDGRVRIDSIHVSSVVTGGTHAIHVLLDLVLDVRIIGFPEPSGAHEAATAHLLVLMHASVYATLIYPGRVLPRWIIRLALHLDEVRRLYHRLLLASNLVRLLRTHLLVVVAHWRRTGVSRVASSALGALHLLLGAVVVPQIVAGVDLVEVGALATHLLVGVAQRAVNGHSIVHLLFGLLGATNVLLSDEFLVQVLGVLAGILLQVNVVIDPILLTVLHAHWDASIHLLRHVMLGLV